MATVWTNHYCCFRLQTPSITILILLWYNTMLLFKDSRIVVLVAAAMIRRTRCPLPSWVTKMSRKKLPWMMMADISFQHTSLSHIIRIFFLVLIWQMIKATPTITANDEVPYGCDVSWHLPVLLWEAAPVQSLRCEEWYITWNHYEEIEHTVIVTQ